MMSNDLGPPPSLADTLALIEDKGGLGTWTWHLDSGTFSFSAGLFRILGLEPGTSTPSFELFKQIVHPADRLGISDPTMLLASGAMTERRLRILRPDGEMRWLRSCGRVVHAPDGTPSHILGIAFDISESRRAQEAYEQQHGLTDALKELFDVIIWKTDADGTVPDPVEWLRTTGQGGSRTSGWGRLEAIHPDDRPVVQDAWTAALRDGHRYGAEFRALWEDGQYLPMISRAVSIRDAGGDIQGWIGFSARRDAVGPGLAVESPAPRQALPIGPDVVRAARGFLGWTASELAEKSGVSFSTVRRIEGNGGHNVSEHSMVAVREAFEVAGIRFVAGEGGSFGIFVAPSGRN